MKIINPNSLALTIDNLNDIFFFGKSLTKSQKEPIAKWLALRQGKAGSYASMFAPTSYDLNRGIRLFTGERIISGAALRHVLGEETCRALILLNVNDSLVKKGLARATKGMLSRLKLSDVHNRVRGTFCCGTCTCAYWRHLSVGGLDKGERELIAGMKYLKSHRDRSGSWFRFPFYYTLLALNEIDFPSAIAELRYATKRCEQYLKRKPGNKIARRRRHLAEKILAKC